MFLGIVLPDGVGGRYNWGLWRVIWNLCSFWLGSWDVWDF
jgi:hypothetical protein